MKTLKNVFGISIPVLGVSVVSTLDVLHGWLRLLGLIIGLVVGLLTIWNKALEIRELRRKQNIPD